MKVFITGANGKIGKNLSNYLLKKNYFCILNSRKLVSSFKAFVFRCRAQKVSLAPKSWNIHQEEQLDWLLNLVQQDPPKLSA